VVGRARSEGSSESSVSHSESCKCDFVTSRGLVGGGLMGWDVFEMYEHFVNVQILREYTMYGGCIFNNAEEVRMG